MGVLCGVRLQHALERFGCCRFSVAIVKGFRAALKKEQGLN